MKAPRLQNSLRTTLYYAAAVAGAVVNIGTSDCGYPDSLSVKRSDVFPAGADAQRYAIHSPNGESIKVEVDSGYTVSWVNLPGTSGTDASTANNQKVAELDCAQLRCGSTYCTCGHVEFDIKPQAGTTPGSFTLKVTSYVRVACESNSPSELTVEPE